MYWFYLKSFILTPFRVCSKPSKISLHYHSLQASKAAAEDKRYHHARSKSKHVSPPQKFS